MTASRSKAQRTTPEAQFVLPKPPRGRASLVVGEEGAAGHAVLRQQVAGLPAIGARLAGLLECQDRFLAEFRTAMGQLQHGLPPAASGSPIDTMRQVLDWCEAVQADLTMEATRAVAGEQAVDLLSLCQDVQHDMQLSAETAATGSTAVGAQPLQVHGFARHTVWGKVAQLAELVEAAICLVQQRTGGHGAILIEVADLPQGVSVRVRGGGANLQEPAPERVAAFREAASAARVLVQPDALGQAAPGLVLVFGAEMRGPARD